MSFRFKELDIPGVILIQPKLFQDGRGFFLETYRTNSFIDNQITPNFVQENFSRSKKGVLRGLHYQLDPYPQGKLVKVIQGKVMDVILDIRFGSPWFGKTICVELDDINHHQVYIPPGFAHGFCVLSETADIFYKCTHYYNHVSERGINWADPDLKIAWPIEHPIISPKDAIYPCLRSVPVEELPKFMSKGIEAKIFS